MTTTTRLARTALGTLAAGALAAASATPALAGDPRGRGRWDRCDRWDRGDRWGHGGGARGAVERCVRAAENQARCLGGYRYADVIYVRNVDRTRFGFLVRGRIEVADGSGWGGRGSYRGRFTCRLDGRGAPLIDFDGIRGLR
jgi:hypothetical protein